MTMIKHLYIHVPFCDNICGYCDFAHIIINRELVKSYLESIREDLNNLPFSDYETIYIGGGTPSSLNKDDLDALLSYIDKYTNKIKEYTIEVNPDSVDVDKIKIMKKHHINRVSIGVQSSNDYLLKIMNRKHDFETVKNVVSLFKQEGIDNISVDLMYSLPYQTMDILKKTIEDILSLNVEHISIYSLTIEENTLFNKKGYKNLDLDIEADMYEYIEKTLKDNDYIHYEVSNFTKRWFQSRHNLGYWNYDDFIGLGPGSASKINNRRYTYTKNVRDYLNNKTIVEDLLLDKEDLMFENVMMSLRTIYGLDLDLFKQRYQVDFNDRYKDAINKNKQHLLFKNNHCICKDLEILNTILVDFLD